MLTANLRKDKHAPSKSFDLGFTLVEVVIVVFILSILASLALPRFEDFKEKMAYVLVKNSMVTAYKECRSSTINGSETPKYTIMLGLHRQNGYYSFFQRYEYIPRKDGTIPATKIGNCFGPLGAHKLGVTKTNGKDIGGKLWINLNTGQRFNSGGLEWSSDGK